jgi:hypothetical protein
VRRALFVAMTAVALQLVTTPAASGGGATFEFDDEYLVIGETVSGRTDVWLGATRTGDLEDGPFQAYLVPSSTRWPEEGLPEGARWLAPITFEPLPGPYATAKVSFEVPAVPAGAYSLMVCNDPCTVQSVGDLVGAWFSVAASPIESRVQALEDRLHWKVWALRREVNRAEKRTEKRETALEGRIGELYRRLADVRADVTSLPRTNPEEGRFDWLGVAGWVLVALVGIAALSRRHRARVAAPVGPEVEWIIPEETGART